MTGCTLNTYLYVLAHISLKEEEREKKKENGMNMNVYKCIKYLLVNTGKKMNFEESYINQNKHIINLFKIGWFLCLMAYQLFLGYLMPKPFS